MDVETLTVCVHYSICLFKNCVKHTFMSTRCYKRRDKKCVNYEKNCAPNTFYVAYLLHFMMSSMSHSHTVINVRGM